VQHQVHSHESTPTCAEASLNTVAFLHSLAPTGCVLCTTRQPSPQEKRRDAEAAAAAKKGGKAGGAAAAAAGPARTPSRPVPPRASRAGAAAATAAAAANSSDDDEHELMRNEGFGAGGFLQVRSRACLTESIDR
jgi:hypothetical protein